MRKYRNYNNKDIIEYAKEVKSIAGLLKKLNLKQAGGNYVNIKKILQELNVDTNHWTGQGWNIGKQLKDWSCYTKSSRLKPHLIKLRGHACECCKMELWMETKIPLEIHHIDGDRTNNNITNLKLLCCNCHALTENWRNKKRLTSETQHDSLNI